MRVTSILSRYRLITNVLALCVALTALVYSQPHALAEPAQCQEMGCVEWSAENGCTATMFCCVFDDGGVMCWQNGNLV